MTDAAVEPAALAGIDVEQSTWPVDRTALWRVLDVLELGQFDVDQAVAMLALQDTALAPFEMRLGNWRIDVPAASARALFNSIVLTGALAAAHEPSIPAAVLTFVVSALFDISRVAVTPDRTHLSAVVRDPCTTVEDWYRQQPEHLRAELSESEFRAIVSQFRDVEPGATIGTGGQGHRFVLLRMPDRGVGPGVPPQVFISYAHDSADHKSQVRRFAELLRDSGIVVVLDQWATTHRKDWSTWAPRAIVRSDFTLIIASPDYKAAGDDFDPSDRNPGVRSEAAVIRDLLHGDRAHWLPKLLPILLPGHDKSEIPYFLQPNSADWYPVDDLTEDGVRDVLSVLTTGRPGPPAPARSEPRPVSAAPAAVEPSWQRLSMQVEVQWRIDVFGQRGSVSPTALELHLVPIGDQPLTMSRLQRVPDTLAGQGRQSAFFTAAEALAIGVNDEIAWAYTDRQTSGLAVFRKGQRTAWVPLIRGKIGFIVNQDYAREKFEQMLVLLSSLDIPLAAELVPVAGLEPLSLVREALTSDADSNTASLGMPGAQPIRLVGEESLTNGEIIGAPEAVADELATRVLVRLRSHR